MALIAVHHNAQTGDESIVGVGRLTKVQAANEAEVALVVADSFHHQGIGTELLRRLVEIGRDERLDCIVADVLAENTAMRRICEKLGFSLNRASDESVIHASLDLHAS
jgi:acetyltransferase